MGFLIGIFAKIGLGEKLAAAAAYALIIAALVAALLWMRADAYSDGRNAEAAAWKEAEAKAAERVAAAAGHASTAAEARAEAHTETVEAEKEKIDEALRQGDSPLDVLFGPTGLSE